MTQETQNAMAEARSAEEAAWRAVEAAEQSLLDQLAASIAKKADAKAKAIVNRNPDVARAIGRDALQSLRESIEAAAEKISEEMRSSIDEIKWPEPDRWGTSPDSVTSPIVAWLAPRLAPMRRALNDAGFETADRTRADERSLTPDDFVTEALGAKVAHALDKLGDAQRDVSTAKAADDRADVDDLWN